MSTLRDGIENILMDCYSEEEQESAWGVAFEDVEVPFPATLLGVPIAVQGFRVNDAGTPQCLVVRDSPPHQRWVGVEDLDDENLPDEFSHVLTLYRAWLSGGY